MGIITRVGDDDRNHGIFWGEIAPCQHFVQLYELEGAFLDTLEAFVAAGLAGGEGVPVIATASHLGTLDMRLRARGIDVDAAVCEDRYIPLDAADTLGHFMNKGWPDEQRFRDVVGRIVSRARNGGRRVRAFGEMVAIMWARGEHGATVHLEHLWHQLCRAHDFSLLCADPKSGFTQDTRESMREICEAHSASVA